MVRYLGLNLVEHLVELLLLLVVLQHLDHFLVSLKGSLALLPLRPRTLPLRHPRPHPSKVRVVPLSEPLLVDTQHSSSNPQHRTTVLPPRPLLLALPCLLLRPTSSSSPWQVELQLPLLPRTSAHQQQADQLACLPLPQLLVVLLALLPLAVFPLLPLDREAPLLLDPPEVHPVASGMLDPLFLEPPLCQSMLASSTVLLLQAVLWVCLRPLIPWVTYKRVQRPPGEQLLPPVVLLQVEEQINWVQVPPLSLLWQRWT